MKHQQCLLAIPAITLFLPINGQDVFINELHDDNRGTISDQQEKRFSSIYNLSGMLVYPTELHSSDNQIDLHHLPSGIYNVRISRNKDVTNIRLIKK